MHRYANDMIPSHLTHPGEILQDELEARDMSQMELARITGISKSHINQLISCKRNVTSAIAVRLEHALGIKAENWLNLQSRYNHLKSLKELPSLRKELVPA